MKVKIVVTVPLSHAEAVRQALGEAGAGHFGEYSFCSFTAVGTGRFMPSDKANPYIGTTGKLEEVEEERIEVVCDREKAKKVATAIRHVHPYEEPAIDVYPLLDESEL